MIRLSGSKIALRGFLRRAQDKCQIPAFGLDLGIQAEQNWTY